MQTYIEKKQRLIDEFRGKVGHHAIGLSKDKSNLFRDRKHVPKQKLTVKDFNHVLTVNPDQHWVEVEGMTTYEDLVAAMLPYGLMPAVVPELKSITVGGAVAGVGIESSSFKYGLVHETVLEMEILLGDGTTVICTPENEHQDLFFGFPNSYGTLGYVLKLRLQAIPIKQYVKLQHIPDTDTASYFQAVSDWCQQDIDFIDGTIFAPNKLYLTIATFADTAPYVSDYTDKQIYYRSIAKKTTDYLTTKDYIWRWDTDWFWCSKNLYVQNPIIRRIVGKYRLNSVTYTKVMRWNSNWQLSKRLHRLLGVHTESVIQDVDIPIANAADFLDFFHREIGITPIWMCPVHPHNAKTQFPLFPMDSQMLYVNFGFWDVVKSRQTHPAGYYNQKIEAKVANLGGIKSLYSDAFYTPDAFWQAYNKPIYDRLKAKYDPQGIFKDLYQKTVCRE